MTASGNVLGSTTRRGAARVAGGGAPNGEGRARRLLNIVVALVGVVLALPLMLVVAALIKLTSGGPVLFPDGRGRQHAPPHRHRRQAVHDPQVPDDARRSRERVAPGVGRAR